MRKCLLRTFGVLFLIILGIQDSLCQKIDLKVVFPADIASERISISYDNGKESKNIQPIITNHIWTLNDSLYDPYSLIVFYLENMKTKITSGQAFWVSDKPAKIIFHNDSLTKGELLKYTTLNAWSSNDVCKSMKNPEISQAQTELNNYWLQNYDNLDANPLKMDTFEHRRNGIVERKLEQVRMCKKDYFVLDYFESGIVKTRNAFTATELLSFFNDSFPDSLKNTFKGRRIEKDLTARINSKKGSEAPDFEIKALSGKKVSLKELKGKYVLLDFWASWCAPCIKMAPKLKEIGDKYPRNKIEIISVTLDKDYNQFLTALKRIDTDFTHVFGDSNIVEKYAVGGIPQVILIDPNGIVLYNREEDGNLGKLVDLLERIVH